MKSEMVSIVMATFNGEKYLRQQLDSILGQTCRHFELIVVDDASTDGTLPILEEYAALDDRIHVYPAVKNLGLAANFERGLRLAKGDYIVLSDQDDIFRKDKIERLLTVLKGQPDRDLAISDLSLIDEEGNAIAQSMWRYQKLNPKQGKPFRRLLYSNFATGCAMMFRRRLLELAIPFPADCIVHDWWLAVVAASSGAGGMILVDEQLTAYRQHGANVIGAKAADTFKIGTVFSRIKEPRRAVSGSDNRLNIWKQQIARLEGYLRRDLWSGEERLMIIKMKNTLEGYLTDAHSGFLSRISKLPQRLRCAASTGSFRNCIAEVLVTVRPQK